MGDRVERSSVVRGPNGGEGVVRGPIGVVLGLQGVVRGGGPRSRSDGEGWGKRSMPIADGTSEFQNFSRWTPNPSTFRFVIPGGMSAVHRGSPRSLRPGGPPFSPFVVRYISYNFLYFQRKCPIFSYIFNEKFLYFGRCPI